MYFCREASVEWGPVFLYHVFRCYFSYSPMNSRHYLLVPPLSCLYICSLKWSLNVFSKQQQQKKRPCLSSSGIRFCQRDIWRTYFPFVWSNFSRLIPTDIIPANMIDLANLLRKDISLTMEIKTCKLDFDVSACSCVLFLFLRYSWR